MENYKKECAERDCASLCFRCKEASIHHMEEGGKREQEYELYQQNRALDAAACDDVKKYLRVVKIGIGFHNYWHNNIQILNYNFKILASHFSLFVECLIVYGRGD